MRTSRSQTRYRSGTAASTFHLFHLEEVRFIVYAQAVSSFIHADLSLVVLNGLGMDIVSCQTSLWTGLSFTFAWE